MVSRVGEMLFLLDEQARSLVAARASPMARAMAGMTRFLLELAAGESAVPGEAPQAGTNPQGLVGADLSGPPWGPALRHPIASWSGQAADGDVIEPTESRLVIVDFARMAPWPIWNRFHEVIDGVAVPYSRGLVVLRAHKVGATSSDVDVAVRNLMVDEEFNTTTISVTSTSEATFNLGTSFFVPLLPGTNVVEFVFNAETDTAEIHIDSIDIYQGAKLEH